MTHEDDDRLPDEVALEASEETEVTASEETETSTPSEQTAEKPTEEPQEEDKPTEEDTESEDGTQDEPKPSRRQKQRQRHREHVQGLESEVAALEKQVEALQGFAPEDAPDRNSFEDPDEYIAELAAFKSRKANAEDQTKALESQKEAKAEEIKGELNREFEEQAAEASERYQDFDAVARNPDLPITAEMGELIVRSDVGADVLYYLGKNINEAHAIKNSPPLEQAKAIGAIEAKLSMPQPKKTTDAPPPPTTLAGTSTPDKDPTKMSMTEYKAWREKRSA